MFAYPQAVSPSLRSHLESQAAFFNDFSNSVTSVFQHICSANLKLAHAMLEETTTVGQRLLTTKDATEALAIMASSAQPASDKLRAYQQQISRLAADAQVNLSRVTQQHSQETSRTARDLADEVGRTAVEQTENSLRQQREVMEKTMEKARDNAGQQFKAGSARSGDSGAGSQDKSAGGGASVQVDAQAGGASIHGSASGPNGAHQQGNKKTG